MSSVRWERNDSPASSPSAGWRAYIGTHYVGTVYVDGDAFFGSYVRDKVLPYSQPLAAQALVRYVEAGGR